MAHLASVTIVSRDKIEYSREKFIKFTRYM